MTPYYEDDSVTLYHGDCREVDVWLEADVLVTDPPYGVSWKSHGGGRGSTRTTKNAGIQNDADVSARDEMLALWGRSRPAVVFGAFRMPRPPAYRQTLVWHKPPDSGLIGSATGYRNDIDAVFLCGKWPVIPAHSSSVLVSSATNIGNPSGVIAQSGGHPHAKPVDILGRLILNAPAGTVADPFSGSGSTLVAAKLAGRRAIGVELEERYCEMAAKRLQQDTLFGGAA